MGVQLPPYPRSGVILSVGAKQLPSLIDAAYPLYIVAYLLSHQKEEVRAIGVTVLLQMAEDCAEYVAYMNHIQTCAKCRARSEMVREIYIAVLEDED